MQVYSSKQGKYEVRLCIKYVEHRNLNMQKQGVRRNFEECEYLLSAKNKVERREIKGDWWGIKIIHSRLQRIHRWKNENNSNWGGQ